MLTTVKNQASKTYELMRVGLRTFIVTDPRDRHSSPHSRSNFMDTQRALAGILKPGDTVDQFAARCKAQAEKRRLYTVE